MDLRLTDSTAFVTGASSGIGAETAVVLAEEGVDVVVGYGSDAAGAERTAARVESLGRSAWPVPIDVADESATVAAAAAIEEAVGGLDVLVLSAGVLSTAPFEQLDPAEWRRVVDVNLTGTFLCLQTLLPLMRDGGAVVTVASAANFTGAVDQAHYAASKAGVVNLTKTAARVAAPRVRVNCVAPGITITPMGEDAIDALDEDYMRRKLLADSYARADDIGRCIAFVASPVAGFMYGATVDVNGGRYQR